MTSLTLLRAETTIPGCSSWDRLQCAMAPWMAPSSDPALLLRFSTGVAAAAAGGRKKNPFALPQDGVDEDDEDDEEHSGEVPGALVATSRTRRMMPEKDLRWWHTSS